MGKQFRETLWFKKGLLDAVQAEAAAAQSDDLQPNAVDMLPVEDRYLDDGSVTREDSIHLSVRTGNTQYVPMIKAVSFDDGPGIGPLVGDLKRGRRKVIAMLGASVVAACAVLMLYVM